MRTEAESDEPRPAAPGVNLHPVERALVGIDDRVGSDEAIGGRQDEPVLGVGLGVAPRQLEPVRAVQVPGRRPVIELSLHAGYESAPKWTPLLI
jgi:hypothetical protein